MAGVVTAVLEDDAVWGGPLLCATKVEDEG